jgi:DNA topoisomerase I
MPTESSSADRRWRRLGTPRSGFRYVRPDGTPVRSPSALARIRALAIPPAWTEVRIAPTASARVQATGTDAAGRTQYRYSPAHTARQSTRKYRKLLPYAQALPRLRSVTASHLRQRGLTRERVLATAVRLMMRGFFRVGSERYATRNRTFGLVTLRKSHVEVKGDSLRFRYRGKSGVQQRQVVAGTPLVRMIRELLKLEGTRLFQYRAEDGSIRVVRSADINAYIKEILGEQYTSKDIRTWGGTVRTALVLAELGPPATPAEAAKNLKLACRLVSAELGNTPAVCRSAYIHPLVMERYPAGETIMPYMRKTARPGEGDSTGRYYPEEAALMRFLERHSSPGSPRARKRGARRTGSTSRRRSPAAAARARR